MRIDRPSGSSSLTPPAQDGGATTQDTNTTPAASAATTGDALAALAQNRTMLAAVNPRRPVQKAPSKSRQNRPDRRQAPSRGNTPTDGTITSAKNQFQQEIGERAQNREQFHKLMKVVYGSRYNEQTVENVRQQALNGDFSFLPKARFVDNATLNGNYAAYDAESGTILLNEGLKNNPELLADYYAEEAGHHIDTLFGKGDAVGDEGEMLRHIMNGTVLSADQVAAIRSENDKGAITVDGKTIEVEFGFFKKIKKAFKKVKKTVSGIIENPLDGPKKIWKGIKKVGKKVWKGIKKAGNWLMTSTIGNYVISAALAAFTVVTGGVGSAAMIAWEAAKQAALAIGKSVLVQQAGKLVSKVTGSETLGRIAGAVGAAVGSGKVDFSSTGKLATTAGQVAKDIAISETKRVVNKEIIQKIDSPYLQQLAGFATDYGIDQAGNYAHGKITAYIEGQKKVEVKVDGKKPNSTAPDATESTDSSGSVTDIFDVRAQAKRGLDMASKVTLDQVIDTIAPEELGNVLQSLIGKEGGEFTVGNLVDAVKDGFNNFEGMNATQVAEALKGYVVTGIERVGEIDRDDIARYAGIAFDQAGEIKLNDLVGAAGYKDQRSRAIIEYLARETGKTPKTLELEHVFGLLTGAASDIGSNDAEPAQVATTG